MDLAVVNTSGQLVDIGQVLKTQDEVLDEPRSVLAAIGDVFLALVVSGDLLLLAAKCPNSRPQNGKPKWNNLPHFRPGPKSGPWRGRGRGPGRGPGRAPDEAPG